MVVVRVFALILFGSCIKINEWCVMCLIKGSPNVQSFSPIPPLSLPLSFACTHIHIHLATHKIHSFLSMCPSVSTPHPHTHSSTHMAFHSWLHSKHIYHLTTFTIIIIHVIERNYFMRLVIATHAGAVAVTAATRMCMYSTNIYICI